MSSRRWRQARASRLSRRARLWLAVIKNRVEGPRADCLAATALTLAVALGSCSHATWAASAVSQTEAPKQTTPQGRDPPRADNGEPLPPTVDKEVIPPPPTGDEDIYMDAPDPDAGHEKK